MFLIILNLYPKRGAWCSYRTNRTALPLAQPAASWNDFMHVKSCVLMMAVKCGRTTTAGKRENWMRRKTAIVRLSLFVTLHYPPPIGRHCITDLFLRGQPLRRNCDGGEIKRVRSVNSVETSFFFFIDMYPSTVSTSLMLLLLVITREPICI